MSVYGCEVIDGDGYFDMMIPLDNEVYKTLIYDADKQEYRWLGE